MGGSKPGHSKTIFTLSEEEKKEILDSMDRLMKSQDALLDRLNNMGTRVITTKDITIPYKPEHFEEV